MRLSKFESAGIKPLGEGEERKVFINPKNERRIISETKNNTEKDFFLLDEHREKDTPRQLKGRYCLTKIVHLLLPKNIPDIYEAGESRDGIQIIDAERIAHTPGHALLQEARQAGRNEDSAAKKIIKELGEGMGELTSKLDELGFSFSIDENVGNYTKDEDGNVHYLETFKPWEADVLDAKKLVILFEEETLKKAIENVPDQKVKEKCTRLLERLLALFEEEKRNLQKQRELNLPECGPYIKSLETILAPFITAEALAVLNAISTEEEAIESKERTLANAALGPILKTLKFLEEKTANITEEQCADLREKYETLKRAVGMRSRGIVDHSR